MFPWMVLVGVAAVSAAQAEIHNCTEAATGYNCNKPKSAALRKHEVELETEYLCKEATKAVLHWRSKTIPIMGIDDYGSYYVNVYLANEKSRIKVFGDFTEPGVPYIKFLNLTPNTTYSFGIMFKTNESYETMEVFTKENYTTLAKNVDKLSNVTHSNISDLVVYSDEIRTNFSWTPVPENVCSYQLVIHQNSSYDKTIDNPKHIITRAQELHTVELTNLRHSSVVTVGVFATIDDERPEGVGLVAGSPFWMSFKTPNCLEFYEWNYTVCAPLTPINLTASVEDCLLSLDWAPIDPHPPYYQIFMKPTNPKREGIREAIPGFFHSFKASTRELGEYFNILVSGHSHAGSSAAAYVGVENNCTPAEAAEPFAPHFPKNNTIYLGPAFHSTTTVTPTVADPGPLDTEQSHSSVFLILITVCLIVIAAFVSTYVGYKWYNLYKTRKAESPQPLRESSEMVTLAKEKSEDGSSESSKEDTSIDDDGEFEVRRQSLHLKEVVGEGEFGVVRRAYLVQGIDKKEVAVKMLRDDASGEDKKQLKLELEVMKSVGTHNNIVCLVGFCSSNHMLVVEYCSQGDLQNYLRDIWRSKNWAKDVYKKNNPGRSGENENVVSNLLYNTTEVEKKQLNVTIFDLISLARQVALGMEYLSSNKVVHRDLAARNILLNENFTVKISDFGLSRDVYEENMYRHKGVRRLPFKWMAIESLVHQMFTTQSDVWSFGILLWEIMTLGGCPYPSLQSGQVFKSLLRGERLERPKLCPKNVYDIMYECWDSLPHQRPTFSSLVQRLEDIIQSESQHRYLELDEVMVNYSHLYEASQERDDVRAEVNDQKHDSEFSLQQVVSA